jgi:hypothetical protein
MLNQEQLKALVEEINVIRKREPQPESEPEDPAARQAILDSKDEQIAELENENEGFRSENEGLRHEIAQMSAMVHEICEEHGIDPEEELRNAEPKTD